MEFGDLAHVVILGEIGGGLCDVVAGFVDVAEGLVVKSEIEMAANSSSRIKR